MNKHQCLDGTSARPSVWARDGRGIPLCRVCNVCRAQKLSRYRPEIIAGYSTLDVDEPIEPNDVPMRTINTRHLASAAPIETADCPSGDNDFYDPDGDDWRDDDDD